MVSPKFQPIKQKKISTKIAEQIKSLINNGELKPGDALPPERELVKVFSVSRASLREALNTLAGMGFLEMSQKHRTIVKSLASGRITDPLHHLLKEDMKTVFELIEVRKAIESWSAYLAARRATADEVAILEKNSNNLDIQIDAAETQQAWAKSSGRSKLYGESMMGSRPTKDPKTNRSQNLIWGWRRISQATRGKEKYASAFYKSLYHLAECRLEYGILEKRQDAIDSALIEIENNDSKSLQQIVDGLNAKLGANSYAYVNTGTIGTDAIRTGFVYRPATTSLRGSHAVLNNSVDARFLDTKNRPTLAQTFVQDSNGGALTIAVNHLKSKGSDCNNNGDPDLADGQGNCNQTRSNAAAALADWLGVDPTGSGDPDFLIIGDLNAYLAEDPLTALKNAGFVNLLEVTNGGDAYSYTFNAQFGALDHALATASLVPQVVATMEWHINADEPPVLDYNLEFGRDPSLFDADSPYRVSDHDPIIVGIDLNKP